MGISLRSVNQRRKSKGSRRSKNRIGLVITFLLFTIFLCLQVVAHWQHYQELVKKPVVKTKVIYKTKTEVQVKKIYINRRKVEAKGVGTERWRPLVEKYFGSATPTALRIMACESGGNPNAVSHTDDHGLMQINGRTWCNFFGVSRQQLKDPETNIRLAHIIYQRGGWSPWACARKLN